MVRYRSTLESSSLTLTLLTFQAHSMIILFDTSMPYSTVEIQRGYFLIFGGLNPFRVNGALSLLYPTAQQRFTDVLY